MSQCKVTHSHGFPHSLPQVPRNCKLCKALQPRFICGKMRHSEYICDTAWILVGFNSTTLSYCCWCSTDILHWWRFVHWFWTKNKATVLYHLELTPYKPHYWIRGDCLHGLVDFKSHFCLHECNMQYGQGQDHPGTCCWFLYLSLLLQ